MDTTAKRRIEKSLPQPDFIPTRARPSSSSSNLAVSRSPGTPDELRNGLPILPLPQGEGRGEAASSAIFPQTQPSSTARRLIKGAVWNLAGAIVARGFGLISSILVARILGREAFGELGVIQSTVGMFGVLAGFGLGMTATKYVAEFRQKDPAKAQRIISMSLLAALISGIAMAAALVISARWLAVHTLSLPRLTPLLQWSALLVLFGALSGTQTGVLSGFEAFKEIARINFISGLATFPLMVGGAWIFGTTGAVWALIFSLAIACILNHSALQAEARSAFHEPDRGEPQNSETPLGVAMSIEGAPQRSVAEFPANFPPGNWRETRELCPEGGSIDIATPGGVSESARTTIPKAGVFSIFEWQILWRFSIPAMLGSIVVVPVNWICTVLLVNQPNGYAEMGIFNAANHWRTAILFLPTTFAGVFLAMLSNLAGGEDKTSYRRVLKYNVTFAGCVAALGAIVISCFSAFIMKCYGADFSRGSGVLVLLVFAAAVMAVNQALGVVLASKGAMWRGFFANAIWALIMLGTALIWVRSSGAAGLALATLVAYPFQTACLLLLGADKRPKRKP